MKRGVFLVGLVGVVLLVSVAGASATSGVTKCGSLNISERNGTGGHTLFPTKDITAKGVSCSYAKSFVKKLFKDEGIPKGWKSTDKIGHGRYPIEAIWTKGHDQITYHYSCSGCSIDR
jgi:hypothetical protein